MEENEEEIEIKEKRKQLKKGEGKEDIVEKRGEGEE
jgi:hypothetical protein